MHDTNMRLRSIRPGFGQRRPGVCPCVKSKGPVGHERPASPTDLSLEARLGRPTACSLGGLAASRAASRPCGWPPTAASTTTSALPTTMARRVLPDSIAMDRSTPTWGGGDGVVPIIGSGQSGAQDGVLNVNYGLATDVRLLSVRPNGSVVVATADGVIQRLL